MIFFSLGVWCFYCISGELCRVVVAVQQQFAGLAQDLPILNNLDSSDFKWTLTINVKASEIKNMFSNMEQSTCVDVSVTMDQNLCKKIYWFFFPRQKAKFRECSGIQHKVMSLVYSRYQLDKI